MIILDKKENSIDIYTMKAQNEELKRYRNSIMQKHQNESHFYQLMTNSDKTIENLNKSREVDTKFLNYGLSDKSNDRICFKKLSIKVKLIYFSFFLITLGTYFLSLN